MLTPSQISDIKHRDPDAFNLWRLVTDAINRFGLQMGIDPKPAPHTVAAIALPPPRCPATIEIIVVSPVVFVSLGAAQDATDSVFYFVERSTTATFNEVTQYALGHGRHLAVPEPPGTTYWRAFAKYQMSARSPFIVWEG